MGRTILYMWNSPLPAPALLPMTWTIRVGTFSVINLSFSSSSWACGGQRGVQRDVQRDAGNLEN